MKTAIQTKEAPEAPHLLSQAIIANGLIFVSGQIHNDLNGKMVGGSIDEKIAQIMQNIEAILKAAKATLDDILKVTIYVTEISYLADINRVYPGYFLEALPAREAMCVQSLPLGAQIEISVIATQASV